MSVDTIVFGNVTSDTMVKRMHTIRVYLFLLSALLGKEEDSLIIRYADVWSCDTDISGRLFGYWDTEPGFVPRSWVL